MTAMVRTVRLTAAESFWYVLGCIWFGAMYFAKVPAKKALSEAGLAQMTSAEHFWYVLQCIWFGAGYFAKIPVKKALSEMSHAPAAGYEPAPAGGYQPDYGRPVQTPRRDYSPPSLPDYGPQALDRGAANPAQGFPQGRRHARREDPRQQGY